MKSTWKTGLFIALALVEISGKAFAQGGVDAEVNESDLATAPYGQPATPSPSRPAAPVTNKVAVRRPRVESNSSSLRFEPFVGVTSSNFSGGDSTHSFSARNGTAAGVNILIGDANSFQFETGLIYAERGGKEMYSSDNSALAQKWQIDYKLKYLEIPAIARLSFQTTRSTHLFFKGGVVLGLLQDASGDVSNTQNYNQNNYYNGYAGTPYNVYYNYNQNNSSSIKDYFNSTDVRWVAGLGTNVTLTRSIGWTIQGDYQSSLNKVSTSQPNGYYGSTSMGLTTTTFSISTGVTFDL